MDAIRFEFCSFAKDLDREGEKTGTYVSNSYIVGQI